MNETTDYWLVLLALATIIGYPIGLVAHMVAANTFGWTFNPDTNRWEDTNESR